MFPLNKSQVAEFEVRNRMTSRKEGKIFIVANGTAAAIRDGEGRGRRGR